MANVTKATFATRLRARSSANGQHWQDTEPTPTILIPDLDEVSANRLGDLAGGRPRLAGRKRKAAEISSALPGSRNSSKEDSSIDVARLLADLQEAGILPPDTDSDASSSADISESEDDIMAEPSQPTQQATQPVEDPRRLGKHLSDISNDDLADVICILHPQTTTAVDATLATMLLSPQHILQNEDLAGVTEDDLIQPAFQEIRDVALRISSKVKSRQDGFVFGRNPKQCDILLCDDPQEKLVSNRHFKIYVNNQGSLMVQDLSTNGIWVDDVHLRSKALRAMQKPPTRALNNGSIISVICSGDPRPEAKFLVRIPSRGENEDLYEAQLRKYLEEQGTVANFASMRESSYGNFWNGGSKYNFTGNLGKGAFATVYRVQTKRDGHIFAAKELDKRRFMKNGQLDVKFDNELKIMQNLKHPNIVEYVDSHTHGHYIYIVMECISGGELQTELRSRGSLSEPEVQAITHQITHALHYLHRRGITHRDIKPDNILIASRDPLVVKLSDFGLSKCVTDQETFLKTFCGTLLYCAPEIYPDYSTYNDGIQLKRRRVGEAAPKTSPYSEAVDMWSFGAVIFHLLCGKPPIAGRGDDKGAQMLNNIMTKDVDFGPLRAAGVSEQGIDFVRLLLNRNPRVRPTEVDCLNHAWLRDVPDMFKYEDEGPEPEVIRRALDAIQEAEEEDDLQMLEEVQQLTQPPIRQDSTTSLSPARPIKKRRMSEEHAFVSEIQYPALPSLAPSSGSANAPGGGKLFGEITASVIRSSGIFGGQPPTMANPAMPKLQQQVEQISVNDFRSKQDDSSAMSVDDASEHYFPPPTNIDDDPQLPHGSAPSLLGAEAQIGQLNVASPEAEATDGTTPETGNPVTPITRELSPSNPVNQSAENSQDRESRRSQLSKYSRQIDLNLLEDEMAYEAELRAREDARAENKRRAETFGGRQEARQVPSIEFATTIDAATGRDVQHITDSMAHAHTLSSPTIRLDEFAFAKPPRRFGKLTTLPGSYTNITINLEDRGTIWGRSPSCTIQHTDLKDVRIPKVALRVIFWAPGMEAFEKNGGNWTGVPGIQTVISTSASAGIHVNGILLTEKAKDDEAALYGKIYSGDIITIYESADGSTFLKFKVEITYGSSSLGRPEKEKPFQSHREKKYYGEYIQRESMRKSMRERDTNLAVTSHGAADSAKAKSA